MIQILTGDLADGRAVVLHPEKKLFFAFPVREWSERLGIRGLDVDKQEHGGVSQSSPLGPLCTLYCRLALPLNKNCTSDFSYLLHGFIFFFFLNTSLPALNSTLFWIRAVAMTVRYFPSPIPG